MTGNQNYEYEKKLTHSNNKMLGGVCAGLALYPNSPPLSPSVAFVYPGYNESPLDQSRVRLLRPRCLVVRRSSCIIPFLLLFSSVSLAACGIGDFVSVFLFLEL